MTYEELGLLARFADGELMDLGTAQKVAHLAVDALLHVEEVRAAHLARVRRNRVGKPPAKQRKRKVYLTRQENQWGDLVPKRGTKAAWLADQRRMGLCR